MQPQTFASHLGKIISLIGNDSFASGFYTLVDDLIGVDHCTVFLSNDSGPRSIVAEARGASTAARVRGLAQSYVQSGYLSDPVWERTAAAGKDHCSTFLLMPADLPDPQFRSEFYTRPNIKCELGMAARVNDARIYVAFYRENGRDAFPRACIDMVQSYGEAIVSVIQKHAEITGQHATPSAVPYAVSQQELFSRVRAAILADSGHLTSREAEICASIVLGYTILGISMNLGISVNTVATHRKRAYAKLRVSSQNELFARYVSHVERNKEARH